MDEITVVKCNHLGKETWRYTGAVLKQSAKAVLLQAYFNRPDLPFHGLVLGQGDRFVELFYNDRWYNLFEIHDRATDALKGWYCNVTRPAQIAPGRVTYEDLALDLLVYASGGQLVLDEDEFAALCLPPDDQQQALAALAELRRLADGGLPLLESLI